MIVAAAPRMTVVKLGGSHAGSDRCDRWLARIAAMPEAVLVPGGGPFADAVRAAQPVMALDDAAAHDMALMAMGQFGRALLARLSALGLPAAPADDPAAIRDALARRALPVWLPWPHMRAMPGIAASWDVTSDSLALWLAERLGAPAALIVKHAAATVETARALVDRAFPVFRAAYAGAVRVVGPEGLDGAPGVAL